MGFVETGGTRDQITSALDWGPKGSGYRNVGYALTSTWSDYGMPTPTCNDRAGVDAHVYAGDKCGAKSQGGQRWGTCDAWRSSCGKKFNDYLDWAAGLVDAVTVAAGKTPNSPGWVSPCVFGEMWSDAMGTISKYVGSKDQVTGLFYPEPGQPGYVPRHASWIFGGDGYKSDYPNFKKTWEGDKSWWYSGNYEDYSMEWRVRVSNAEFCRARMDSVYPCPGGGQYPAWCGGCKDKGLLGYCYDYHCSHPPLVYYDRKFSELREDLLNALLIYEGKNKSLLAGATIDEHCKEQIVEATAQAPPVGIVDEDQVAYQQAVADEKQAIADEAARVSIMEQLEGEATEPVLPAWAIAGGVALAGFLIYRRLRR